MSAVLVTGGAGFIGSHIVDALVDAGEEVRVLDSLDATAHDGRPDYTNPEATYRWAPVERISAHADLLNGLDAVCHQAAKVGLGVGFGDVEAYVTANDLGTAALLQALHTTGFDGRLVLASSMVVYGEGRYRCGAHGVVSPSPRPPADLDAGRYGSRCPACGSTWDPMAARFCGRCGERTEAKKEERARVCPACKLSAYPRVAPAVMALVKRENQILLARSPHFPPGMYSALAGFVEPGESAEAACFREVREETGSAFEPDAVTGLYLWQGPAGRTILRVAFAGRVGERPLQCIAIPGVGDDGPAAGGERARQGPAQTARRSGHDGGRHGEPPRCVAPACTYEACRGRCLRPRPQAPNGPVVGPTTGRKARRTGETGCLPPTVAGPTAGARAPRSWPRAPRGRRATRPGCGRSARAWPAGWTRGS